MTVHILACRVFEPELEAVLPRFREELDDAEIKVTYLCASLHCHLNKLQEEMVSTLEKMTQEEDSRIILLYGTMCHPKLNEFLSGFDLVRFPDRNCVPLIMPGITDELAKDFVLTAGWIKYWDDLYSPYDSYGFYEQMVFGDTHVCETTDEEIICVFEATGVPIDTTDVTISYFEGKIRNAIMHAMSLKRRSVTASANA